VCGSYEWLHRCLTAAVDDYESSAEDTTTLTRRKEDMEDGHEARYAPASVWTPWRKCKSAARIEELLLAWWSNTQLIQSATEDIQSARFKVYVTAQIRVQYV
jgi:hypothetical protein